MKHPHVDFRIPQRFVALLDWLLEGFDPEEGLAPWDHALPKLSLCLYDVDSFLLAARASFPMHDDVQPQMELGYQNYPLEVIPFAGNGGDGLDYAWVLLAPELDLDDLPCVSFAPSWESAVWLGDDTKSALETLLVGYDHDMGKRVDKKKRAALCEALDLSPDYSRKDVGGSAWVGVARGRGKKKVARELSPAVPAGYRFEPTLDGIGVLAPASAFAPGRVDVSKGRDDATMLAVARKYLARGKPASALVALKEAFFYDAPKENISLRREAFLALGRPALASRASAWLAQNEE